MTAEQINAILTTGAFPGARTPTELIETHISWVILTPDFAFKIKKPVRFGFLDFSSLEKRHFFCEEELRLNRRLAPDLYLQVVPIAMVNNQLTIGPTDASPEDYAVQMRRVDHKQQMDKCLERGNVKAVQMEALAQVLAPFHRKEVLAPNGNYHPASHWADFAEIYRFGNDIEQQLGPQAYQQMQHWRSSLPEFLERHSKRFLERQEKGFWVDGHGDLHARNIFLPETGPVVFDCIEFSAHFRQLDILNDIAFLCMDLEARQHPELAEVFLKAYCQHWDVMPKPEDRLLFQFFKAYRANVRLKVALLELRQHQNSDLAEQAQLYWKLMAEYLETL